MGINNLQKIKERLLTAWARHIKPRFSRAMYIPLIILVIALSLRLYFAFTCDAKPDYSDMAGYNRLAVEGGFDTYRPPLYPLFLRAIYSVFGNYNYTSVYVIQGIISALTVLLMYLLTSRFCSRRAGIIAASICTVYPHFIAYNLTTLTETLSIFLAVSIMATAVFTLREKIRAPIHAVLIGLGSLIKPAFLLFTPGLLITSKKKLLFLLTLIAVLTPWTIRNAVVHHKFVPVSDTGAFNFYMSYHEGASGGFVGLTPEQKASISIGYEDSGSPTGSQKACVKLAFDFIKNNKTRTVQILFRKASFLISRGWTKHVLGGIIGSNRNLNSIMSYAYLPVVILGFTGLARFYRKQHRPVVLPVLGYIVLIIIFSIFKFRFRLLIEPLLIIYASFLFDSKKLGGTIRRRPLIDTADSC